MEQSQIKRVLGEERTICVRRVTGPKAPQLIFRSTSSVLQVAPGEVAAETAIASDQEPEKAQISKTTSCMEWQDGLSFGTVHCRGFMWAGAWIL